jgi:voltage-gated potassium channel
LFERVVEYRTMLGPTRSPSNLLPMDARSARIQRRLEPLTLVAALLVIPLIVIEEGNYGETWDTIGVIVNWGTWLAFVAEAAIMLHVVPDRRRWLRDHPIDIAVIVLTPPFLDALAPVRLLRLLRLLRLFRFAPVARTMLSAEGVRYAGILAVITVVAGGAAFADVEHGYNTAEGMYWAITTMTTVGYGDLSPATTEGRLLAVVVMAVGIGFVAVLTGAIAERFLAREVEEEVEQVEADLDDATSAIVVELRAMQRRLADMEVALKDRR